MEVNKANELEDIRARLGLNRRQMSDLLGVDPSAWTRWTRSPKGAPEVVHRALGWYEKLISKEPLIHEKYEVEALKAELQKLRNRLNKVNSTSNSEKIDQLHLGLPLDWKEEKEVLLSKIEKQESISAGWKLLLVINAFVLVLLVMTQLFSK